MDAYGVFEKTRGGQWGWPELWRSQELGGPASLRGTGTFGLRSEEVEATRGPPQGEMRGLCC